MGWLGLIVFQNRFGLLRNISGNVVEKNDRLAFWDCAVNVLSAARYLAQACGLSDRLADRNRRFFLLLRRLSDELNQGEDDFSLTVMVGTCFWVNSCILFLKRDQLHSRERCKKSMTNHSENVVSSSLIAS